MIRFCCYMEKIDLPQWLRNEIKKRDWSQVDLSRKTGISTTQIARILSGERGMGVETLVSIANAFGISPITMLFPRKHFRKSVARSPCVWDFCLA